jgi:ABC-type oligopeptide transport system substrate-binding subunit
MRKIYWYVTAYLRKHGLKFFLAVALGTGLFSFLIPLVQMRLTNRVTHYVGIIGEYNLRALPEVVQAQMSRSLLVADTDGTLILDLSDELASDGQTYTFTFSEDHFWQNGDKLELTEIVYPTKEATVTYTDQQIIYQLPEVFASFPQILTTPILKYAVVKHNLFFEREMVYGLKPAAMIDYTYTDSTRRNLKEVVLSDETTHERWIYRFYFTEDQAITAYKLGEVDILYDMTNLGEIKDWSTTVVQERVLPDQYLAVFFNTIDPLLASKNLRQALSYAVEKERVGYTRALGPISESSWAFFKGTKSYDKNLDQGVERLLAELPGAPLELKLTTTTSYFDIASRIKEDWEALGEAAAEKCLETVEIEDKIPCEYLRLRITIQIQALPDTNNFQTLLVGQRVSTDPDQYYLWHSGLATNFTGYKNTKVDHTLEKGRQVVDRQERLTLYQEFQQDLLEDPPAIFLWYLKSYDLVRR